MADLCLTEWSFADGVQLTTAAMDALFDDLREDLNLGGSVEQLSQLQDQLVDAALHQATRQGWRFRMDVPPFANAHESIQCRCAQWSLKRMFQTVARCQPARQPTDDTWQRILQFLVTHRAFSTIGPRIAEAAAGSSEWQRISYVRTWSPRFHYKLVVPRAQPTTAPSPCSSPNCLCCRAHRPRRLACPSGCEQCLEAWVLSCVAKSWTANLRKLAATWAR